MFEQYTEEFLNERFILTSKYWKWYKALIINRGNNPIINEYSEQHHFIPRCCNGNENDIVKLTFREHFLAHHLLVKCSKGLFKKSLLHSLAYLAAGGHNTNRPKLNSRQYAIIKKASILKIKEFGHPRGMLGKTHSDEFKKRKSTMMMGEGHHNYGKKIKEETCNKISEGLKNYYKDKPGSRTGMKNTPEAIKKTADKLRGRPSKLKGTTMSDEAKKNMSIVRKNKPKISCPYCDKLCDEFNAKRWHLDNCKFKRDDKFSLIVSKPNENGET